MHFFKLKTLVAMQLKDKVDLSFLKSRRRALFGIVGILGKFVLSTAVFFVFFWLASALKIFSFSGLIPSSLVTALFTLMFVLSLITCSVGLTRALYLSADNRVLLTLPASSDTVFFSKFALYCVFELKKNFMFFLPMYFAYGLVCNAVWFFYPWLLVCYVLVSFMTVAVGAVISVPALFITDFVKRRKWLQFTLMAIATALIGYGLVKLINLMPQSINIAGRWGTISSTVQNALNTFAEKFRVFDTLNLMIIGGNAEIRTSVFTWNALWGVLIVLGVSVVCMLLTFFAVRPLFFRMASAQFEFEKVVVPPKANKTHGKIFSVLCYVLKRDLRSGSFIVAQVSSLIVLPIAVFLMNKTYAAMNTRLTGQYMTVAFTLLISLLIVNNDNVAYSSIYSVDGNARPLMKTQPVSPFTLALSLVPRAVVMIFSVATAVFLWSKVAELSFYDSFMLFWLIVFEGLAHLLWCAETDIMNPQHEQYATLGLSYDNPNERKSILAAFLLAALFSFMMYFIMKEGQSMAITKIAVVTLIFLAARVFLYFTRVRLYYPER